MIVAAYGQILTKEILEVPKFGCLNIHASLLPRWRGAAPIERAIITSGSAINIQTIPSKLLAYKSPRNRMIEVIIPPKLNFFTKEFPKI